MRQRQRERERKIPLFIPPLPPQGVPLYSQDSPPPPVISFSHFLAQFSQLFDMINLSHWYANFVVVIVFSSHILGETYFQASSYFPPNNIREILKDLDFRQTYHPVLQFSPNIPESWKQY